MERSKPKEMFCKMKMNVKGVLAEKADMNGFYSCPSYKTEQRGPTYVFCAQLRTKSSLEMGSRWSCVDNGRSVKCR